MHVAYFSNQFADREGHGLARYSRELHHALTTTQPDLEVTPVASWSSCEPAVVKQMQDATGLHLLPWGRRLTPLAWAFLNYPTIEQWMDKPIDLVHAVALGFPIATRKPYVVTVHDIGPLTHPQFFTNTKPWIMEKSLKQALARADAFICVSQSTANELESYIGYSLQERIHVVHEGVSPFFYEESHSACLADLNDLPESDVSFILTAGKISPRKNVTSVVKAFSKLIDTIPHHLVLVGASGWDMEEVYKGISSPAVAERIHFAGFVSDEQLRALYSAANLYVHPSLYEGFGLTILEAMAGGCPVVTSNVYSLPEVAGDAAVQVDPCDIEAISEAIRNVCTDNAIAQGLIEKGRIRASEFSWQLTADNVAAIYRKIV